MMSNTINIKKDDKVKIIAGKDKGKVGKVLKVIGKKNRLLIENINLVKRHTKPNAQNRQGGILESEAPIHWSNVMLILTRELRDQARDRRTIFMIAVLPILLYPLLGMSMFQVAQFMEEKSSRVLVAGMSDLLGQADLPPLLDPEDTSRFDVSLFRGAGQDRLLDVTLFSDEPARQENPLWW